MQKYNFKNLNILSLSDTIYTGVVSTHDLEATHAAYNEEK